MDWFSWLSKTPLEPSLTYEYGLLFSRNELQLEEDLAYFNHEFLQSMGISVAKHRLEILKLARKELGGANSNGLAKLVLALNKTKKVVTKYFSKKGSCHEVAIIRSLPLEAAGRHSREWGGAILPKIKARAIAKSGPLDGRLVNIQDKMMISNNKINLKLPSGPLDRKVNDRLVFEYRSPKLSRPIDERVLGSTNRSPIVSKGKTTPRFASPKNYTGDYYDDDQSLWSTLFQDLKPT